MVTIGRQRRSPWVWIVLAGVGLLLIGGAWRLTPQITASAPDDGLTAAGNDTIISITFNRPMDHASVESHVSLDPDVAGHFVWQDNEMRFVPTQPWPDGTAVHVSVAPGALSRLFLPLLTGRQWSFDVGAPRLIYALQAQGRPQLVSRDLGETDAQALTHAPEGVLDFAVAQGNGDLVYLAASQEGGQAIHAVDVRTGEDKVLMPCPAPGCRRVRISPDGAWLTLETQPGPQGSPTGPGQVWVAPVDGSRNPAALGQPGHDLRNALWSPDGKLAVYDATAQAMLVFAVPPDFRSLASIPNKLGEMGAWSPDGSSLIYPEIVFIDRVATPPATPSAEPDFYSHIFRYEIETGSVTDLSGQDNGLIEDASPAYSPDGQWIAFARKSLEPTRWTLGRQMWLMRADGSQARPLTSQPVMNYSTFAWRPDSAVMVYVQSDQTDPSRPPELGWLDVATGQTHKLVEGGYSPEWTP